jgi:uncharacterized protein (DUF1778 family)
LLNLGRKHVEQGVAVKDLRTARLSIRLTPGEQDLIRWAAREQQVPVTTFVLGAAIARGRELANAASTRPVDRVD